jgi:hypothetical protein
MRVAVSDIDPGKYGEGTDSLPTASTKPVNMVDREVYGKKGT